MENSVHMPANRARKMVGLPEPVLNFRIYPEKRTGAYLEVHIYKTSRDLQDVLKSWRPRMRKEVYAFVWDEWGPRRYGRIYFYLESVTDNCVAHEIFHAVQLWADRYLRLDPGDIVGWNHRVHERVAEAHGNMVSDFWREFTDAGFKRTECWGFERTEKNGK